MARDRMELSMLDLEAKALLLAVADPPPRATTDEAVDTAAVDDAGVVNKSDCRPVLMKKRAENAMARLTNVFLNCSRLDALLPRILCEILVSVDFTLPRIFESPLLAVPLDILMDSCVLLLLRAVAGGRGIQAAPF